MPHIPRWCVFAAVVAAGLALAMVVDFITRHPGQTLLVLVLVYVLTRPHLPMNFASDELDRHHNDFAASLAQFVLPASYLAFMVGGTLGNREQHGLAAALAGTFAVLYVVDRLLAFAIRKAAEAWQLHQLRRALNEQDDVVGGGVPR